MRSGIASPSGTRIMHTSGAPADCSASRAVAIAGLAISRARFEANPANRARMSAATPAGNGGIHTAPCGTEDEIPKSDSRNSRSVAPATAASRPDRRTASAARAPSHSARDGSGAAVRIVTIANTMSRTYERTATGTSAPAAGRGAQSIETCERFLLLLHRHGSPHVHGKVGSAVELVGPRFDLPEGDHDVVAWIHLQVAGKLGHLVGAVVRVELGSHIRRQLRGVECHVVWTTTDDRKLDGIASVDGHVLRLEPVPLGVTDHLDFHRLSGDRGRSSNGNRSRRSCCRRCRRSRRWRLWLLLPATAGAEDDCARNERHTNEPHSVGPPRPNCIVGLLYRRCGLCGPRHVKLFTFRDKANVAPGG